MLPIRRGQEPQQLREQRWWRLARARAHIRTNQSTDGLEITGYDVEPVKATLRERQHKKCAYCDRLHEEPSQPIEHFRPKKGAIRADGSEDTLCYWWLAWSWENLLFACTVCNSTGYKGNKLPLAPNATPLPAGSADLSAEDIHLVDPAREHPMDHIQFRFDGVRWTPEGKTDAGWETIKVFGLDRIGLLEYYDLKAAEVSASIEDIRHAIQEGDATKVLELWRRRIARHLGNPNATGFLHAEYAALIWDMFDQAFTADERQRFKLTMPRPGHNLPADPPATDLPIPPAWATFSDETIWALRAVGKRAARPGPSLTLFNLHVRAALLAVLNEPSHQQQSADALRALLAQPPNTCALTDVQDILDALKHEGRATHDATADLWSLAPSSP